MKTYPVTIKISVEGDHPDLPGFTDIIINNILYIGKVQSLSRASTDGKATAKLGINAVYGDAAEASGSTSI